MLVLVVVNDDCALTKRFCKAPRSARNPLMVLIALSTINKAVLAPVGIPLVIFVTSTELTACKALVPAVAVRKVVPVDDVMAKEPEEWKSTVPPTVDELPPEAKLTLVPNSTPALVSPEILIPIAEPVVFVTPMS